MKLTRRLGVLALLTPLLSSFVLAQTPGDCPNAFRGNTRNNLPARTGNVFQLYIPANGRYLYGLTQLGFMRAGLTDPASPSPMVLGNIGRRLDSGGVVPMNCDCFQGGSVMSAAEAPDGSTRIISDWIPQSGGGLAGQLARADGTGDPAFAQQIDLPGGVAGIPASIHLPTAGKFIGYFPGSSNVQIVDLTVTTGDVSNSAALRPFATVPWPGPTQLQAERVQVPTLGFDKFLLVGATLTSGMIRIAEIDPLTGLFTEQASIRATGDPATLDIAVVGGRIFVFAAEGLAGLQIYEYTPSTRRLTPASSIPGNIAVAVVRGGDFPAIFLHRQVGIVESYIDIYDTRFLVQPGSPRRAHSLRHAGSSDGFTSRGLEAMVTTNGPVVTAHVYRVVVGTCPLPGCELRIQTDKVDISCIGADPTAPPVAGAIGENVSAAQRLGVEQTRNYLGDRWRIRDASATILPISRLDWDFTYTGSFVAEIIANPPGAWSDVNPAYFPCDQSAPGRDITTGAGCHVGLSSGSFQFALRSHNQNGQSQNTFISSPYNVLAPQASVAGFDGTTLRVLSAGSANASGSQGNTAEATFAWTFNPGSVALSGPGVPVPTTATSFVLDVTYKGGYLSRVSGAVQQVDLVPDFTLSPNPVLNGSALTLTNTMQRGGTTTLDSVTYVITPTGASGALPGSFLNVNGTAGVTAPGTTGSYTIALTYNFSGPQGVNQTLVVTKPFSTTSFAPNPAIGIYIDPNRSQPVFCLSGLCQLTTGTPYYLYDEEAIPTGVTHPGTQWYYVSSSGESPIGSTPAGSAGPVTHTVPTPCPSGCALKLVVGGVTRTINVTVNNAAPPPPTPTPPPPPPPPPSGFTVTLTGPTTGTVRANLTFTATATGGSGTVSYAWRWGDVAVSSSFTPGPSVNTYAYDRSGTFPVAVRATDSAGAQATATMDVTISAPAGPPLVVSLAGPARGRVSTPVTFTASVSGGSSPYTYAWRWGDNPLGGPFATGGATNSHAYPATGTFTATVRVTDAAGQTATGTASLTIDNAFQALIVPGAAWLNLGTDVWATDIAVANPGAQPLSLAVAFLPYLTESPGSVDLSTLTFRAIDTPLAPNGGSWSQTNVVQWLGGRDTDKGTLVLRYEGPVPVVNGRVYFARGSNPLGPAYGAPVEAFKADQGGRVLAPASATPRGVEAGGEQTLIGLRSTDLYRFGITLYNSSGVEMRSELRAFDETGAAVEINSDDAGTRGTVREVRIRPYQQVYLRNQDLGLPQHPNKRYVFRSNKIGADGSLVAFGAAIDTKTSDLEQFTDDTPPAVSDEQGSVYLYIPGASRFDSGNGAKWRTELRAYNPANVERTVTVEYLYAGAGEPESISSATVRVGAGKLVAADDVIGSVMDEFTPHDLKALSTTGLLRIRYSPEVPGAPMVLSARNYDDQVAGTAGTQLSVYSRREGVSFGEPSIYVPGAQEDTGEKARLRTTLGVFAMDNRQTRVRVSAVKRDGTVLPGGTHEFVLNQPGASGHMSQIFMPAIAGIVSNEAMTIKTEVLEGGRAGVYVVTVDTNTRDTSFKPGRPVH